MTVAVSLSLEDSDEIMGSLTRQGCWGRMLLDVWDVCCREVVSL